MSDLRTFKRMKQRKGSRQCDGSSELFDVVFHEGVLEPITMCVVRSARGSTAHCTDLGTQRWK